jgi:hypothetical protein
VTRGPEVLCACAIAGAFLTLGWALQKPTNVVLWDARQYYALAGQFATGDTPFAEVPYVYRIGVPWLASRLRPSDPRSAFGLINVVSAVAIALLLDVWLWRWIGSPAVRLGMVALCAAAWLGPARYLFFNPGYVDPPFIACVLAALIVVSVLAHDCSNANLALLTGLVIFGTFIRETMAIPAAAFVFVNNPIRSRWSGLSAAPRVPGWALWIPIAAATLTIAWTHALVTVDTAERSFLGAVFQYLHKSPLSYLLAWFTAFGPVLAIVAFDWRAAARTLADHEWLLVFGVLCGGLAFIGGSDTERFAYWSLPVVYLLLGRAIERHKAMLGSAGLATSILVLQAVSARVFWGIPDPAGDATGLAAQSWPARVYGVVDRLVVMDGFHWNLWSSFGSRPFRLVRLAAYLIVTVALVSWMRVRARTSPACPEISPVRS